MACEGVEFGLAVYPDPEDVERQFMETDPHRVMAALRGTVLSLIFNRRDDLPKVMRKEILAAGWTVAALDGYPALMTINTPVEAPLAALAGRGDRGRHILAG